MNVHKTFRKCNGHLLNVLCTLNLRTLSRVFISQLDFVSCLISLLELNLINQVSGFWSCRKNTMIFYHLSVLAVDVPINRVVIVAIARTILMTTIPCSLLGLSLWITFVCTHRIWVAYQNDQAKTEKHFLYGKVKP